MKIDLYKDAESFAQSKRFTDWKKEFVKTDLYNKLEEVWGLYGFLTLEGEEEGSHVFCNLDSLTFSLHDAIPHAMRRQTRNQISTPMMTLMGSVSHVSITICAM